jgi:uncharacterized membrane protein
VPDAATAPNARWAWWLSLPLAVLGVADSAYLTYTHYHPAALVCSRTSTIDCHKVTESAQSNIFGHIPVSVTGLVYFVVMALLMTPWAWQAGNEWVHRFRMAATAGGMGMVVYLVIAEVQIGAICLYCTGVHILNFGLFLVVLAAYLLRPIADLPPEPPART